MNRRFDLLIFDWDGTLADSESLIVGSMQAAITDLKLPARTDRQIRELIGLGLNEALQALYPEFQLPQLLELLAGYRARWVHSGLQEAPLFPGALQALRDFGAPSQNFVYADVDGNIGYQVPGRIPVRAADNSGLVPSPST